MKLYGVPRSPFAARVQAVIALKGLDVEVAPPPGGGPKSAEYLALSPLGRLPALVLDDGSVLPESEVIAEYLEQAFPEPALYPADAAARAQARLIARVAELYVMGPLFGLFAHLADRQGPEAERLFGQMTAGLEHLEHYLAVEGYAAGAAMSHADCALAPFLFWVKEIARMFARPDPLAAFPKLRRYEAVIGAEPVFAALLAGMAEDLAALRRPRQA